jgi:hypothetical protein
VRNRGKYGADSPCFDAFVALHHAGVALAQMRATRAHGEGSATDRERAMAAPLLLQSRAGAPFDLLGHLSSVNGTPILDWRALDEWAGRKPDADGDGAAIDAGRRAWLLHLRAALGPHFELIETDAAYVLTSLEPRVAKATIDFVVKTRRRVQSVLTGIAAFPPGEKSILIVEQLARDWDAFTRFVVAADRADAGAAAAQSAFALDLGRCASALLEIDQAGGWSPRPA